MNERVCMTARGRRPGAATRTNISPLSPIRDLDARGPGTGMLDGVDEGFVDDFGQHGAVACLGDGGCRGIRDARVEVHEGAPAGEHAVEASRRRGVVRGEKLIEGGVGLVAEASDVVRGGRVLVGERREDDAAALDSAVQHRCRVTQLLGSAGRLDREVGSRFRELARGSLLLFSHRSMRVEGECENDRDGGQGDGRHVHERAVLWEEQVGDRRGAGAGEQPHDEEGGGQHALRHLSEYRVRHEVDHDDRGRRDGRTEDVSGERDDERHAQHRVEDARPEEGRRREAQGTPSYGREGRSRGARVETGVRCARGDTGVGEGRRPFGGRRLLLQCVTGRPYPLGEGAHRVEVDGPGECRVTAGAHLALDAGDERCRLARAVGGDGGRGIQAVECGGEPFRDRTGAPAALGDDRDDGKEGEGGEEVREDARDDGSGREVAERRREHRAVDEGAGDRDGDERDRDRHAAGERARQPPLEHRDARDRDGEDHPADGGGDHRPPVCGRSPAVLDRHEDDRRDGERGGRAPPREETPAARGTPIGAATTPAARRDVRSAILFPK